LEFEGKSEFENWSDCIITNPALRWVLALCLTLPACGTREFKVTIEPTYNQISQYIIQPKCTSCHPTLATYEGLIDQVRAGNASRSELYEVVAEGEMPPQPVALFTEEVDAIRAWIDGGALNN